MFVSLIFQRALTTKEILIADVRTANRNSRSSGIIKMTKPDSHFIIAPEKACYIKERSVRTTTTRDVHFYWDSLCKYESDCE
jgi:hypothetical protein